MSLILLSGGVDSAALATMTPYDAAITVNYGHRSARGEINAASAIADALNLTHTVITVDASAIGSGLLAGSEPAAASPAAEWWPFRNQLLVTIAAAYAISHGYNLIIVGSVAGDGARHKDGTPGFYSAISDLIAMQEGGIEVSAPAAHLTALQLLQQSQITDDVLGWTHSCHRANLACGNCPGCWKRAELMAAYRSS
jgi:7-cyano-7-deazaguanine synthase